MTVINKYKMVEQRLCSSYQSACFILLKASGHIIIREKFTYWYVFNIVPKIILNFISCFIFNSTAVSILENLKTRPRGYKTLSMLNLAEHKIYPAHKC